jgi:hypothetical protein
MNFISTIQFLSKDENWTPLLKFAYRTGLIIGLVLGGGFGFWFSQLIK